MKKLIAMVVAAMMCTLLLASVSFAEEAPADAAGGWILNEKIADGISEEDVVIFETATAELPVQYDLIALLGTQVVEGTNYAFLAVASAEFIPQPTLAIVIVYADPDGTAVFSSFAPFTIADILTLGEGESEGDSAGDSGESAEGAPAEAAVGAGETVVINLMGTDVEVVYSITDGTFEASYSFNGNDVVAKGTVESDGTMMVTEHTPEDVPDMYVQGAITELQNTIE